MISPRYLPVGESALSVEFGDTVSEAINARVLALDAALRARSPDGVIELVPTYRSLMIHFDPLRATIAGLRTEIELALAAVVEAGTPGVHWQVPVCYGGEFGVDLESLAATHGLTEERVIEIHTGATYRVYMIGFAPGFSYLGGLSEELHTPRRTEPRLTTPAGTISIGGAQTAITSVAVPSGWHLIGRTPLRIFDPDGDAYGRPVFLLNPGDSVRFEPISAADWHVLSDRVKHGEYHPQPEPDA